MDIRSAIIGALPDTWASARQLTTVLLDQWSYRHVQDTLTRLAAEGVILKFVDASERRWVSRYCRKHDVADIVIPRNRVGVLRKRRAAYA